MCALFFQNNVYLLGNLLNIEGFSFHVNSFDRVESNNLKLVKITCSMELEFIKPIISKVDIYF